MMSPPNGILRPLGNFKGLDSVRELEYWETYRVSRKRKEAVGVRQ